MRAPLAYVGTRSRRPPSSAHTDWPRALPRMSQHAMSIAESASVKIPPGPELPAARLSLAAMASVWVGSSPTTRPASVSTATLSAAVSAPPKKVRPTPTSPWSVPSSRVTNSRVSVGAGRPTTSGLSAGVRSTRVVTWVIFMAGSRLRQEVADDDARARRGQRRDGRLGTKDLARRVAPAERRRRILDGPPVNLQHTIDEVQDPIVVQTGTGVEAALVLAVELEARLCDFDDEHGPRGMLAAVVSPASASDRDIRLGLRHIVQRDRPLRSYEPGRSEGSAEGVLDEADRRIVRAALGLAHDQLAPEELDRLAGTEDIDLDQPSVLRPGPAPRSSRIRRHERRPRRAPRGVNVLCAILLPRRGVTSGTAPARQDRHHGERSRLRWCRDRLPAGQQPHGRATPERGTRCGAQRDRHGRVLRRQRGARRAGHLQSAARGLPL